MLIKVQVCKFKTFNMGNNITWAISEFTEQPQHYIPYQHGSFEVYHVCV